MSGFDLMSTIYKTVFLKRSVNLTIISFTITRDMFSSQISESKIDVFKAAESTYISYAFITTHMLVYVRHITCFLLADAESLYLDLDTPAVCSLELLSLALLLLLPPTAPPDLLSL